MGQSRSFAELAKKLERAAAGIETKSDEQVLLRNAKLAKTTIAASVRLAVPRGTVNGGRKGKPKRVTVGYDKLRSGSYIVRANGPLHLVERPTKPHSIPKDLGGTLTHTASGRRRSAKSQAKREAELTRVFRIGTNVVRGPIKHPGTKGKFPFRNGTKAFLPSAGKALERGIDTIMRGVF